MKKIINSILGISAVLVLASCEDFLAVKPVDSVSSDSMLTNEKELELFANGLMHTYRPDADAVAQGDNYTDLMATRGSTKFWFPNDIYKPVDRGAWSYNNVRRANWFILKMDRAKGNVSEAVWNHYQGVGRFWRAYFHYDKVLAYGDLPWQDFLVEPNEEDKLYAPRDDREYVVHKCIEDLQYAIENCSTESAYRRTINKWVAAAYLSRIALYEGTYRKYFDVNTSTYKPWTNKYETADELLQIAVDASKVIMDGGQFTLNSNYHANFVTEDLSSNPEMIWVAEYTTGDANVTHSLTSDFRGATTAGPSPTKEFVNQFLKLDGTPITTDQISLTEELGVNNGRDPRLKACVNHEGLKYLALSGSTYKRWMPCQLTMTGYNLIKWDIQEEVQFQVAKCGNSIPIMRYAEVLLNYAEAKAELNGGVLSDADWDLTVGAIRKRAGLTGTGRPTSVDPRLYKYYADAYDFEEGDGQSSRATELKSHLTADLVEIRRERVTELGFEDRRTDDLHRWHCLSLIPMRNTNGSGWHGIWVTKEDYTNGMLFNATFVLDANGTSNKDYHYDSATDTYTYVGKGNGEYYLWHGLITFGKGQASETSFSISNTGADQSYSLSEGDHGYLTFHYALGWDVKKYLYPINSSSTLVKNPNLVQNHGWED